MALTARRNLGSLASHEDFRAAAARRLPRFLYDYIEGGAGDEITLAANRRDLAAIALRPRAFQDATDVHTGATVLGARMAMPVMLGPVGSLGLFRRNGEAIACAAARDAGISACMSSFSMTAPEDTCLAQLPAGAFQLYALRDRGRMHALLDRIAAAGVGVLFVTVDTAVSGVRDRDTRNGLRRLTRPGAGLLADMLRHPCWLADMARAGSPRMFLAADWPEAGRTYLEQATFLAGQIDPAFDPEALAALRAGWAGRLVVKGILTVEDARTAVTCGADAIVVSNHGGRQLDSAPSTIRALQEIVPAIGDEVEILIDGGFRRGTDTLKALSLGASGVLLGRSYVYALTAAGQPGLEHFLKVYEAELRTAMALTGHCQIN